jgi:hypothetical protein
MHLCFAIPWRTSWKPLWYVFPYDSNTCLTFIVSLFMIFRLCFFLCYNMVAKFYCQYYVSYAHILSSLIPARSRLWWCMSPQKLFFYYHLPTRGRAGVKLGDAWYVPNVSIIFDASCLFIHHLLYVLLHFVAFYAFFGTNLLTRCHSTSSLFFCCFVFQKSYMGNILGIGRNKSQTVYFFRSVTKSKDETEGGQELGSP